MNLVNILKMLLEILKRVELKCIDIYQKTISLDHGFLGMIFPNYRGCKYIPTCSEYGYGVVERFGIFKGNYLMLRRILKCTPWSVADSYDPIPEK